LFNTTKIMTPELNQLLKDIQDGLISETPSIRTVNRQGNTEGIEKLPQKFPFTDICLDEKANILHVEIAAAGFAKEDFDISIEEGILIIKGNLSEESIKDDAAMKYFQRDIAKRSFVRKIKLMPEFAQSENVMASTEDGILTVSIFPVEEVKPKSFKIEVE
jgi:HSP20 family molecular chaperone IbpA